MVRARRLPRRVGARPPRPAPLPRLPADPRLLPLVDRAQGRVGAGLPPPPAPARRARTRRRRRGPGAEGRPPSAAHAAPQGSRRAARRVSSTRPTPTIPARSRDLAIVELLYGAGPPGQRMLRTRRRRRRPRAGARSPCSEKVQKSAGSRSASPPATPSRPTSAPAARQLGASQPSAGGGDALFLNARGRRMTPRDVRRVLDRHPLRRRPRRCTPTRCATPTPHISSKEEQISEQFRSCSDTPMWERHRSTLT